MSQISNNRRKRAIRRGIAVILILVVGPSAWLIYNNLRDHSPIVRTSTLAAGNITSIMSITTTIKPGAVQKTYVSRQLVKTVLVQAGDQVKKGDPLIVFDLTEQKEQQEAAANAKKQAEEAAAKISATLASQSKNAQTAQTDLQRQISRLSTGVSGLTSALSGLGGTNPVLLSIEDNLAQTIAGQLALIDPASPDAAAKVQEVLETMLAGVQIGDNPAYGQQLDQLDQSVEKINSAFTGLLKSLTSSTGLVSSLGGSSAISQLGELSAAAQTAVAQATQAEKLARQALDAAVETIYAETDGIIAQVNAVAGEYAGSSGSTSSSSLASLFGGDSNNSGNSASALDSLSASQTPVIILYDNTRPKAVFQANRLDSKKLAVGMPVTYRQDDKTWQGKITYKGKIASNSSLGDSSSDSQSNLLGSMSSVSGLTAEPVIDLEMSIEGEGLTDLTLGFNLDAEIETASAKNVLLLPAEAMKKELGVYYAFVLGADNRLIRRTFTPGIQSDRYAEVLEGLQVGDKVILNPSNDLSDGLPVKEKNDE